HEREAVLERFHAVGSLPDLRQAVEIVPDVLCAAANLLGGHGRVKRVDFRPQMSGDQPVAVDRNALDALRGVSEPFLPSLEIDSAGKRRHGYELRKGDLRLLG